MTHALQTMTGADEDEKRQKERLQILLMAAKSKVQAFRDEINENFLNPGQIDKKQIPGIRAVRFIEQYHVASRSEFNTQVGGHLTKAIDAFFSIGGDSESTKTAVKDGVKSLIAGSLDAFIGSTSSGESEQKTYVVIPENNSFVRVDIACWKYNFEQTKIINQSDSAVAYVLCKSVVDHTRLTIDEIIYLTTEALATGAAVSDKPAEVPTSKASASRDTKPVAKEIPAELEKMGYTKELLKSLADQLSPENGGVVVFNKMIRKEMTLSYSDIRTYAIANTLLQAGDNGKYILEVTLPTLDGNNGAKRDTPSLGKVQAYIEEMIAVWKKLKVERRED